MIRYFDPKFKHYRKHYILQSLIATCIIFTMSLFIDVLLQTTIIASVSASVFILYTMPKKRVSRGRYLFGGYAIGSIIGMLCHQLWYIDVFIVHHVLIAVAVGLTIFLMVITNTEHPPAAALAFGLTVEGATLFTIIGIYISLIIIFMGKKLLGKWLINLM